ncbi:MAG: tRNA(Met) cytidine acetyltransferase [Chromatiales bacterium]|nr:tRNA(Met) cytidine acetyltransferase [Chromatiales bacterium]
MPFDSAAWTDWVAQLATHHWRGMAVFAGERDWGRTRLTSLSGFESRLWVTDRPPSSTHCIDPSQARQELGREYDLVVFDAFAGFDPDAFGSVSGCVRGGGLLVLLCPNLDAWPQYPDPQNRRIAVAPMAPEAVAGRYLARIARLIRQTPEIFLIAENSETRLPHLPPIGETGSVSVTDAHCLTHDQQMAVQALIHVVTGQRKKPVILTSDRGRGKSAALGIAAARLLHEGHGRILVTGPRLDGLAALFERAEYLLEGCLRQRARIRYRDSTIEFQPPDALLEAHRPADLLLVDEAAGIPLPLLEGLLRHYPRIAFASTVHGYEGTGRGFALRFERLVQTHSRGVKRFHLQTPIRWAEGDPLESLVFRMLVLDAEPQKPPTNTTAEKKIERLDRNRLALNESELRGVFGLLVLAHYRTRPFDLRQMLDGPNIDIHVLRLGGHLAGVALVAREGGLDAELTAQIAEGRRRPRGHLLPEALAIHLGIEVAPRLTCLRVMRIAIHPQAQRRGLGSELIQSLLKQPADLLGSSFSAAPQILSFWSRLGLKPARIGIKRGASSAAHSLLMLRGLSAAGKSVENQAVARLRNNLPHLLADPLRDLEAELAAALIQTSGSQPNPAWDVAELKDLRDFADGKRIYEEVMDPIYRLTLCYFSHPQATPSTIDSHQTRLLIQRVLQRRGWEQCEAGEGRDKLTTRLRKAVEALLKWQPIAR